MKWISVKDELPEIYSDVLLYINQKGGFYSVGYLHPNGEWYFCNPLYGDTIIDAEIVNWAKIKIPHLNSDE